MTSTDTSSVPRDSPDQDLHRIDMEDLVVNFLQCSGSILGNSLINPNRQEKFGVQLVNRDIDPCVFRIKYRSLLLYVSKGNRTCFVRKYLA